MVAESRVDGGPIMKRIMPRARGTAYPIKRRYSHIHVTLSDWRGWRRRRRAVTDSDRARGKRCEMRG